VRFLFSRPQRLSFYTLNDASHREANHLPFAVMWSFQTDKTLSTEDDNEVNFHVRFFGSVVVLTKSLPYIRSFLLFELAFFFVFYGTSILLHGLLLLTPRRWDSFPGLYCKKFVRYS